MNEINPDLVSKLKEILGEAKMEMKELYAMGTLYNKSLNGATDAASLVQANYMTNVVSILESDNPKKDAFKDIRQLIADSKVKDFTAFYRFLFDELDNYAKGHIASVILILAEAQYQDSFAIDKELHVMSMIVKLLNELK